jgi:hypothetical protein
MLKYESMLVDTPRSMAHAVRFWGNGKLYGMIRPGELGN